MAQAKQGDAVNVHYTGKLGDGTVFDTSVGREPLQFTIGGSEVIPDFEQAVVGMNPGELKTVKITHQRAYGPHRKEMVLVAGRDKFPLDFQPEVGQHLQLRQDDGYMFFCDSDRGLRNGRDLRCQPSSGRERPDLRYAACRSCIAFLSLC